MEFDRRTVLEVSGMSALALKSDWLGAVPCEPIRLSAVNVNKLLDADEASTAAALRRLQPHFMSGAQLLQSPAGASGSLSVPGNSRIVAVIREGVSSPLIMLCGPGAGRCMMSAAPVFRLQEGCIFGRLGAAVYRRGLATLGLAFIRPEGTVVPERLVVSAVPMT